MKSRDSGVYLCFNNEECALELFVQKYTNIITQGGEPLAIWILSETIFELREDESFSMSKFLSEVGVRVEGEDEEAAALAAFR